jgi:alanine dehydrogenase
MSSDNLTLGIIGTSTKENEFRLPIHPDHFPQLNPTLKNRIFVERDYGIRYGVDEGYLKKYTAGIMSREDLFKHCDVILLPKPTEADFPLFQEEQILWGWPHCVQGEEITQVGIDRRMTFIAWEAMYSWKTAEIPGLHTFYRNNELAGYCSVLHGLQLHGITGQYGPAKRAAVISFGSTARGAIYALRGLGFTDITVYSQRPSYAIQNRIPSIHYRQMVRAAGNPAEVEVDGIENRPVPMIDELVNYSIIVNCVLQDTNRPLMFIKGQEVERLVRGTLIVDVSCDLKMGFDFARPTSFEEPIFQEIDGVTYYGVDHSPSLLWNAATYEISAGLLPYIDVVMGGEKTWEENLTINKAVEIKNGVIQNPNILYFQNRHSEFPHSKQP